MLRGTSLHPSAPRGVTDIDAYVAPSARLKKTFEILAEVKQRGEKALLFCEDLEMQAFLAMAIQERFDLKHRPMCISGKVAGHKRQEMVNAFQSSPSAFDVLILRSEEHTSELQSLMRISYAVLCLKNKTIN